MNPVLTKTAFEDENIDKTDRYLKKKKKRDLLHSIESVITRCDDEILKISDDNMLQTTGAYCNNTVIPSYCSSLRTVVWIPPEQNDRDSNMNQ